MAEKYTYEQLKSFQELKHMHDIKVLKSNKSYTLIRAKITEELNIRLKSGENIILLPAERIILSKNQVAGSSHYIFHEENEFAIHNVFNFTYNKDDVNDTNLYVLINGKKVLSEVIRFLCGKKLTDDVFKGVDLHNGLCLSEDFVQEAITEYEKTKKAVKKAAEQRIKETGVSVSMSLEDKKAFEAYQKSQGEGNNNAKKDVSKENVEQIGEDVKQTEENVEQIEENVGQKVKKQ